MIGLSLWLLAVSLGGPVGAGHDMDSCEACHETGRPADDQLCMTCHEEKFTSHVEYVHPPMEDGCMVCHRLHDAKGAPDLQQSERDLCESCHPPDALGRSHPMGVVVESDGRPLTCASHCHDVHGSNYPFLCTLPPGRELCVRCHGDEIP
jgi:predicted CXXCH cytochrome family protein